mgnify:CR=1 FL=1
MTIAPSRESKPIGSARAGDMTPHMGLHGGRYGSAGRERDHHRVEQPVARLQLRTQHWFNQAAAHAVALGCTVDDLRQLGLSSKRMRERTTRWPPVASCMPVTADDVTTVVEPPALDASGTLPPAAAGDVTTVVEHHALAANGMLQAGWRLGLRLATTAMIEDPAPRANGPLQAGDRR